MINMTLKLYNTLSRKKQAFKPLNPPRVGLYDCGPTVYFYAHIGNMWRYVVSDVLRRVLEYNGFKVKQVMNITDVGHLTEDDLAAAAELGFDGTKAQGNGNVADIDAVTPEEAVVIMAEVVEPEPFDLRVTQVGQKVRIEHPELV